MGAPGWPELACCTASIESVRIVLIQSWSRFGWLTKTPSQDRIGCPRERNDSREHRSAGSGGIVLQKPAIWRTPSALVMATWAGCTVPELYHRSKTEMNERGTKLRFGAKKLWRGDFAEGDEVGFNRHTLGDFHVKNGFKGLEFAGVGDREAQEEFLNGFFTASVFDGALRAERGGAGDDHDGARRVKSGDEGEQSVIFGEERIGRGREIEFLFARLRVDVENGEVAFAWAFGYALEDEFAGSRNFQQ